MAIEPKEVIQQLLGAFKESQGRIQSLERTIVLEVLQTIPSGSTRSRWLTVERDAARDALSQLNKGYLEISFKHEAEISALRKEIVVLREDSAKLQRNKDDEVYGALYSLVAHSNASQGEAPHLRAKYEALKTSHRELKRVGSPLLAFSELDAKQADLVSNAAACEQLALDATQAVRLFMFILICSSDAYFGKRGVADEALRDLQTRHDALKAKKARKSAKDSSEQVAELTTDVNRLNRELNEANKRSYSKLDNVYNEELELSAEVLKRYDKLSANNKEVTRKYLALEAARSTTCGDLKAQNSKLLETCTEVIAAAEQMNGETVQLRAIINEARGQGNRLESVLNVNQAFRNRVQTTVARALYEDFMSALASSVVGGRPDFFSLRPVAKLEVNLTQYLATDPVCAGAVSSALYLPGRTVWSSSDRLHMLAFWPTHRYHPTRGTWSETSDISDLVGSWREVFIDVEDSIFYVGTYRCHDLRFLCPGGTPPPDAVSPLEMIRAARLELLPPEERPGVIKYFFPSGIIDADCVGLQCIGFNSILYDALQRRSTGIKREPDDLFTAEWQRDTKRTRLDIDFPPIDTL
ncbi:hypothetical protein C8R45DRAFT_946644 [Mycena sanguinolenta]|nr:hypothetical protein C8R45DRAFT_946644 [Mycena sanguinolenta]